MLYGNSYNFLFVCHHCPPTHNRLRAHQNPPCVFPTYCLPPCLPAICLHRHARVSHRTQPEPTTEAGRHCCLVLRPCDRVVTSDATACALAPRLCAFPLPLGDQHDCCVSCPRCHLIWCRLLHFLRRRWDSLLQLPVSNPRRTHPPSQLTPRPAAVSALCCLRTLSHLTTVDPSSRVFNDTRRRYTETFPIQTEFEGFPSYHRFCILHNTFHPSCKLVLPQVIFRPSIRWRDYQPSSAEHATLVQLAQFKYQRKQPQKVPRWILHFGLRLLSQDPLPSVPVIIDCLSIIATDLDRAVSNATTLDERYVNI